jgi:hypothetical protein
MVTNISDIIDQIHIPFAPHIVITDFLAHVNFASAMESGL